MSDVIRSVVFTADADGVTPTQAQFAGCRGNTTPPRWRLPWTPPCRDPAYRSSF